MLYILLDGLINIWMKPSVTRIPVRLIARHEVGGMGEHCSVTNTTDERLLVVHDSTPTPAPAAEPIFFSSVRYFVDKK